MKQSIRIFNNPLELAATLADELVHRIKVSANKETPYSVALSGGSTPELLFSFLGDEYSAMVPWEFVHIFWGDERCVSPDHTDSNYGMAKRTLFDKIIIPPSNIHRMEGERDPLIVAEKYSRELTDFLRKRNSIPVFDFIILGIGEDGHTASIFPDQAKLIHSEKMCEVAVHPETKQKRITLTGKVINNAETVAFMVTGKKKAAIIAEILNNENFKYPATFINPVYGSLDWYLDRDAGSLIVT